MRLESIEIKNFRSIENIKIIFPLNKPVVLFGSNNTGKSNILKAIDCIIGEKYTPYIDFLDSDYFCRDKEEFPRIFFKASFDEVFFTDRSSSSNYICFSTNVRTGEQKENLFHFDNDESRKMYVKNKDREKCQFILVDATRDISRQLSYFSQYSILSKMSKKMHESIIKETKEKLDEAFENIKTIFESVSEYKKFHSALQKSFSKNIDGFEHKLDIDLSAYDPNNYFHSLRIIAKENNNIRAFDEFGTGEQQILLLSFVKAYAETFKNEHFILGIEEPEAHLHPLAQKWLSKNLKNLSKSGVQVILTTHSPDFLDIENLDGFVKVSKEDQVTKIIQHTPTTFAAKCLELKAKDDTSEKNILNFYKSNTFHDELIGLFAKKIILVEGASEIFSLPNYFLNSGYDLIKNGVDVIDCRGKSQITRNYRLFESYEIETFCLFDADQDKVGNAELAKTFSFDESEMQLSPNEFSYDLHKKYGYFGKDYENYMRNNFEDYKSKEEELSNLTKQLKAKIISENNKYKPNFIEKIAESLNLKKYENTENPQASESSESPSNENDMEIPF